jgi:thiamine-phosphate pyrophosphorylase
MVREVEVRFPRLYPILDAELALRGAGANRHDCLRRLVQELAGAGVEILQYRNKLDADDVVIEDARAMKEEAGRSGMRLILNDRVPLAETSGWHGVHVGQGDLPPRQARLWVGERGIVGLSTHNEEQIVAASEEPVDYIAVGPVFSTMSKLNPDPVIGLEGVRRARALTGKPLVAIGGITQETAAGVIEAGADAVAVIGAIFGAASGPGRSAGQSAKDFLEIFK